MLKCFEFIFAYFERVLFDGLDDCDYYEIENNYPFSEKILRMKWYMIVVHPIVVKIIVMCITMSFHLTVVKSPVET